MNPSDIAVIAVTVTSLTQTAGCIFIANRVADRLRVVNPVKAPVQDAAAQAQPVSISERRPA